MHVSFWISTFLWKNTQKWNCEICMMFLFLIFWGSFILFSIMTVPVCIPTYSVWGFPFLYILINTYLLSFGNSHSDRCEVISHFDFDLHFSNDQWYWASFHVPIDHLYIFFRKTSVQVLCPFFNWAVCFLMLSLWFSLMKLFDAF